MLLGLVWVGIESVGVRIVVSFGVGMVVIVGRRGCRGFFERFVKEGEREGVEES